MLNARFKEGFAYFSSAFLSTALVISSVEESAFPRNATQLRLVRPLASGWKRFENSRIAHCRGMGVLARVLYPRWFMAVNEKLLWWTRGHMASSLFWCIPT